MNTDLKKLYSEIIKAHNEKPFHYEKRADADVTLKAYNPICGDKFEIYIRQVTHELYFNGIGCAISKASASVMAKSLEGKSVSEALTICDQFLRFVNMESKDNELALTEEMKAFSGVHDFPERIDCATLAWKAMKKYLTTKNS